MKFRPYIIIISIAILTFLFQGCTRIALIKEYKAFSESIVVIPNDMIIIRNGLEDDSLNLDSPKPLLVHFYGSDECTDCALSHMAENLSLAKLAEQNNLDFLIIMSPDSENRDRIEHMIKKMNIPMRVCLDMTGNIESQKVVPKSIPFHVFLLDCEGKPVYIGNPTISESLRNQFDIVVKALN